MNPSFYVPIFLMLFLVLYLARRRAKSAGCHHAAKLRKMRGEGPVMEEIIMRYLGRGVQVTTISDTHTGKLMTYSNGWLTLADKKGREEHLNADYVVRVKGVAINY